MKDSGIFWIGEIPAEWSIARLKNEGTLHGRIGWNGLRSDEFEENSYAYLITGQDFITSSIDWNRCYQIRKERYDEDEFIQLKEGDLLITKDGTIGKVAVVSNMDKPACLNSGIFVLRQKNQTYSPRYLYWFLASPMLKTYNDYMNLGGTTIIHLYQNVFERMPILIPPLLEQQSITAFLDEKCSEIDDMISLQEKIIGELKSYKQSVITEVVCRGLNPDVPMKDSGIEWIGKIPRHWAQPKMSHICNTITDYVASGSFESLRINVPYLDTPDYAMLVRTTDLSGSSRSSGKVYISKHSYDFLKNSNLYGGEIVLPNIGASVGDVYIVPVLYEHMSLAPNSIMFKTNYLDKYYYYFFYSQAGKQSIFSISNSTAQGKFNKTELRGIRVICPPILEQKAIADYLDEKCSEIDALISLKQSKIESLKEYKKSIIYEYVTGKKEVPA